MTNRQAILFMLLSAALFSVMNAVAKYLGDYDTFQIVFFRAIGSVVLGMAYLLKNKIDILGTHRKLLVLRGLVGVTSLVFFFMSLKLLPFGTAVSLRYLAPIFAGIFAVWLLKERIKPIQWFYFLIAFAGVVMLKGFDSKVSFLGLIYVLISAVSVGMVFVLIRKIGTREHPMVIINYFMVISMLVGGVFMIPFWKTPVGSDWYFFISLGIIGFFGQVFMTKAFQLEDASRVGPIKYAEAIERFGKERKLEGKRFKDTRWTTAMNRVPFLIEINLMKKNIKNKLLEKLHAQLDTQIETAQAAINSAKESKNNETKSSAGDKFETGRAMMQIEQEKNELQLSKTFQLKNLLQQIDIEKETETVGFGSLVTTNRGKYFIAIGIGKIKIENEIYFVISLDSPVGKLLLGKRVGEEIEFRGQRFLVEGID